MKPTLPRTVFLLLIIVLVLTPLPASAAADRPLMAGQPFTSPQLDGWDDLNAGIQYYQAGNYQAALSALLDALAQFEASGNLAGQAQTMNMLGMTYRALGRASDEVMYFQRAITILTQLGEMDHLEVVYSNLGRSFHSTQQYPQALEAYQQAYAIASSLNNEPRMAWAMTNLGAEYRELGEYQTALDYYNQAIPLHQGYGQLDGEAITVLNRAVVLHDLGRLQEAAEEYERARELMESLNYTYGVAATLNNLGDLYLNLDQLDDSQASYEEALRICRSIGDPSLEATVLTGLGNIQNRLSEYARALEYYQQAYNIQQQIDDRDGRATSLHNIASVLDAQGDYAGAIERYLQSASLKQELSDPVGEALTYAALGLTYTHMGDYGQALSTLEDALDMALDLESMEVEMSVRNNLGLVQKALARFEEALNSFDIAYELAVELGDDYGRSRALSNVGFVYQAQGRYDEALVAFQQAAVIQEEIGDQAGWGSTQNNIAGVYQSRSDFETALSIYLDVVSSAEAIGDRSTAMTALNNIGLVYLDMGLYSDAMGYFQQALLEAQAIGNRAAEATSMNNIGLVQTYRGELDAAIEAYEQALFYHRQSGDLSGESVALNNLANAQTQAGDYAAAMSSLQDALRIAQDIGIASNEAIVLSNLGNAYAFSGNLADGLEMNAQAFEMMQDLGNRVGKMVVLYTRGLMYEDAGMMEEALESYLQGIDVLESITGEMHVEEYQTALSQRYIDIYLRAVRLLFLSGQPDEAFDLSERARARAFLDAMGNERPELSGDVESALLEDEEQLRMEIGLVEDRLVEVRGGSSSQREGQFAQELEDTLLNLQTAYEDVLSQIAVTNPMLASLVSISTVELSDVQPLLDDQTMLLSYFLTDEMSLAFLITADTYDVVDLGVDPDDIYQAVEAFRNVGLANPAGGVPISLQTLYDALVAPLEEHLSEPVLAVIPHQSLHYVPFAALHDGESYLGDSYVLYYLPSASTLPFLTLDDERPISNPLVFGDPVLSNDELPRLEYAAAEAEDVAAIFGVEPYTSDAASEATLVDEVGGVDAVHLAAHGSFNPAAPLFSRIWLAPDGDEDGRLNVYEVYNLDFGDVSLVTLSACQTNLGALSAGDELVGLNRAFLYGAPSVVASLWSVDDEATGALMTAFYTALAEGQGKAEALASAQAALRSDPDHPEWAHPYYWAAFVLNGSPGAFSGPVEPGAIGGRGSGLPVPLAIIAAVAAVVIIAGVVLVLRKKAERGSSLIMRAHLKKWSGNAGEVPGGLSTRKQREERQ